MAIVTIHYIRHVAPSGEYLYHLNKAAEALGCTLKATRVDSDGEIYARFEYEGDKPKFPLYLDEVLEYTTDSTVKTVAPVVTQNFVAIPDPLAPERDMPANYDPFAMATALVRDIEYARHCSPEVVQRLAKELLKYKELAEGTGA